MAPTAETRRTYVSATTAAPSDRLAIRMTGPAGSRYTAQRTNSPWKLPGTTNVSYDISVIE
jgi:hypothetical protein